MKYVSIKNLNENENVQENVERNRIVLRINPKRETLLIQRRSTKQLPGLTFTCASDWNTDHRGKAARLFVVLEYLSYVFAAYFGLVVQC